MKKNFKTEIKFTRTYKEYINHHPAIREAHCLKAEFPDYFQPIQQNDLFAGRLKHGLVGFSPDEWGSTAFGYYILKPELQNILNDETTDEKNKKEIEEIISFWETENTSAKLRNSYPPEMAKYLPSDDWMNQSGIAFPLYRLTGGNINFKKLMQLGLPGLRKEVSSKMTTAKENNLDEKFYEGSLIALNVINDIIDYYIIDAETQKELADAENILRLNNIIDTLKLIKDSRPKTLREGIQLFWLYANAADVRNYGRMDVYLGDLLANDLDCGIITEVEALKMLQSLWQLMADKHTVVHNRVIIGGKGRANENNADRFAMLAMEASRTVLEIEPQLSLRIYEGMNPDVFDKALEVIGEGRTFPIIYNDDVNLYSVVKAFGFTEKEAEQYVPYGCGEYILEHQSFGTPSGVINLLKALEVTLHNGIDPVTKRQIGLALGTFESFKTFDDLWNAYKKQIEHYVRIMADHEALEYNVSGKIAPYLLMSMLYDDCLEKGKGIFSGGIRYLGGTLETYGNTNTADSLLVIKKLIYEDKSLTKQELLNALNNNFEGFEKIKKKVLDVPKYGNDIDEADEMLLKVHNHVCNYVRDQKDRVGLHSYMIVNINNSANTLMGRSTSASADGRLAFTSMNNGNTPTSGNDKNGITSLLNSIVKPATDIHAGAVQNIKFSSQMFTEHKDELKALLKTYFENGGAQAMITVVNRGDLENAMNEPEKYKHVFVRVGGFSARFVELAKDIQLDILNRTLY